MTAELKLGAIFHLKKKHPCGGDEWEIDKLGTDIGIKCRKCGHHIFIERDILERRIKAFVQKEQ